ncbi:DUF1192 domain-containing protein [Rhizobium sp. YIM 134829]|jgi:uncharacterized small protein (DUF1192 family)|uniref:DUF1192 domain-containing protein n=1 Tax=Rhizobium sp. YIM 134829 TaxID=3390453 RepID=UPI00397B336D
MTLPEDDRPARKTAHEIGADLSLLSADELTARIALLEAEIARLAAERERKAGSRAAAERFFK